MAKPDESPQTVSRAPSAKYTARAEALAEAIDISLPIYERITPIERREHTLKTMNEWKQMALNPRPAFANLRSLAYLEQAFFTYWNEAEEDGDTREFWNLVQARGLPFRRRDLLRAILKRGRIKSNVEYEYIQDMIPAQRQLGNITELEEQQISRMIGDYEKLT